jgi:hypothetical protein
MVMGRPGAEAAAVFPTGITMTLARPRFYPAMGIALALLVAVGFARTYYLKPLFDTPSLPLRTHVHGLLFTAWMGLFIVQARLIATHRMRLHRRLGLAGVMLAVAMILSAYHAAVNPGPDARPPFGFTTEQFLIAPMTNLVLFGAFVTAGLALRRHSDYHKRLMVMATISIVGPAIGRASRLLLANVPNLTSVYAVTALLVLACVVADLVNHRRLHPVTSIGGIIVATSWPLRLAVAKTEEWLTVARWLLAG